MNAASPLSLAGSHSSGRACAARRYDPLIAFQLSYVFFVVAQYLIEATVVTAVAFYGLLMPCLVILCRVDKPSAAITDRQGAGAILGFMALFAYCGVHPLLFMDFGSGAVKTMVNSAVVACFFLASLLFFSRSGDRAITRFFAAVSLAAGVGALISIVLYFADVFPIVYEGVRLSPIGRAGNPNLGAMLYGAAGLGTLYCISQCRRFGARALYSGVFAILSTLVVLTQSRAPMAAYIVCVLLGIVLLSRQRVRIIFILAWGSLFATFLLFAIPGVSEQAVAYVSECLSRKDGFRLELWAQTVDRIKEHPWIGYGFRATLVPPAGAPSVNSPHNLYLATAFYAGVPAAAVFVLLLLLCMWRALRLALSGDAANILAAILLLHGLLSGVTDHAQIVKAPSPLWIIFWLPVAFVLTRATAVRSPTATH